MTKQQNLLLTGCAGFIGFHLAKRLLEEGRPVVGLDNLNDYYDVGLKEDRLKLLQEHDHFTFVKVSLEDRNALSGLFSDYSFDRVIHPAARRKAADESLPLSQASSRQLPETANAFSLCNLSSNYNF